jgi:hypothetical protein
LIRLDQYSDLDFFSIVERGYKGAFIENLAWLEAVCPISCAFQNTHDSQKVLFTDGVFVGFAVLFPADLKSTPHDGGMSHQAERRVRCDGRAPNNSKNVRAAIVGPDAAAHEAIGPIMLHPATGRDLSSLAGRKRLGTVSGFRPCGRGA